MDRAELAVLRDVRIRGRAGILAKGNARSFKSVVGQCDIRITSSGISAVFGEEQEAFDCRDIKEVKACQFREFRDVLMSMEQLKGKLSFIEA